MKIVEKFANEISGQIRTGASISDVMQLLQDFESQNWISVKEYLPEKNKHVLVLRTNPNVVVTGYIHEYGHWIWSNLNGSTHKADSSYKITHWRPLPEFAECVIA
jgi:hypothetical protein